MSSTAASIASFPRGREDPLALLPRTPVREYKKNEVIYNPQDRNETLYLVVEGLVMVSRLAESGKEVVLELCPKNDFFGESGFLSRDGLEEQATALDKTSLMLWTIAELNRLMLRTPVLGPALLRVLAQKLCNANNRIESLCQDSINRRLVKALLHLAQEAGHPAGDQVHLPPITHAHLARYVGTSREVVSQQMNQLRRDHLLTYSRQGIHLDAAALKQRHLHRLPGATRGPQTPTTGLEAGSPQLAGDL